MSAAMKRRFLVVESDRRIRADIRQHYCGTEVEVTFSDNVSDALELAARARFDLVWVNSPASPAGVIEPADLALGSERRGALLH
jgi:DNA-binding NtrC family response regulator